MKLFEPWSPINHFVFSKILKCRENRRWRNYFSLVYIRKLILSSAVAGSMPNPFSYVSIWIIPLNKLIHNWYIDKCSLTARISPNFNFRVNFTFKCLKHHTTTSIIAIWISYSDFVTPKTSYQTPNLLKYRIITWTSFNYFEHVFSLHLIFLCGCR